jgi:hypothetical protein
VSIVLTKKWSAHWELYGWACRTCNGRKVRCSFLSKRKKSVEIIIDSADEVTTPRPKKAKTSGLLPVSGLVSVEVRSSCFRMTNVLDALRQQNDCLWQIIEMQRALVESALLLSKIRSSMV